MLANNQKNIRLDPRTQILLLVAANVAAFLQNSIYIEFALIIALAVLLFCCGCAKSGLKWTFSFAFLLMLQYYIFPNVPKIFSTMFSFLSLYFRKFFPCLMVGTLIVKTTPVRYFILALKKWHFPKKFIIPLSVTLRYFPAIKEEASHIKDAMKLRKIKGFAKIECYVVPLMISATNTADELSAAAVTRGIENPIPSTSMVDIRLYVQDYICLFVAMIFIILATFSV